MPAVFAGRSKRHIGESCHGSAIMVEHGAIRARLYDVNHRFSPVDLVAVYGDDLHYFWNPDRYPPLAVRRPLAFSDAMRTELSRLSACVVGVSGTGSIVAEQLARIGFGNIMLVDFDRIELKNLNRILNSSIADAEARRLKVEVIAEAILRYRCDVRVTSIPSGIGCADAIKAAAGADVLFSCVDSDGGRQICDLMSSAFLQPLFDVGVTIPVQTTGAGPSILDVVGRVDYVWPGGSTLGDRKVFTPASLAAEYLARADVASHSARVKEGYMPGSLEEAPSVISLNMRAASACVMEFIARAYPFRHDPNVQRARTVFSLAACEEEYSSEDGFSKTANDGLARGFKRPLLGLPILED
nr:ThiF family adenylyltransferase [Massilia terrae]